MGFSDDRRDVAFPILDIQMVPAWCCENVRIRTFWGCEIEKRADYCWIKSCVSRSCDAERPCICHCLRGNLKFPSQRISGIQTTRRGSQDLPKKNRSTHLARSAFMYTSKHYYVGVSRLSSSLNLCFTTYAYLEENRKPRKYMCQETQRTSKRVRVNETPVRGQHPLITYGSNACHGTDTCQ